MICARFSRKRIIYSSKSIGQVGQVVEFPCFVCRSSRQIDSLTKEKVNCLLI